MRTKDFAERLKLAQTQPSLDVALLRLGYELKHVGVGSRSGCENYRISTVKGVDGDYSALVFGRHSNGIWIVLDNKQRYGRLTYDAIGCLSTFFGHSFDEAVYALTGGERALARSKPLVPRELKKKTADVEFKAPIKSDGLFSATFAYLAGRGIDGKLLRSLVKQGLVYQTDFVTKKGKTIPRVIVFAIFDNSGKQVGADLRSTVTVGDFKFRHIVEGSDPRWAWHFSIGVDAVGRDTPVFYCESAIDAMSLYLLTGASGVYASLCGCKDITLKSMVRQIGGKPFICVDNDSAGDLFYERNKEYPRLLPHGKDWNEDLQRRNKL